FLIAGALVGDDDRVQAGTGDSVTMFFMSAQGRTTVSLIDFCTGARNPPIHNAERAIDVTGDNVGVLCVMDAPSVARLRGWGWGSQPYHFTLKAWASGQEVAGGCDVITIRLVDVLGANHGYLRNLHHNRTASTWLRYYSSNGYGAQYGRILGYTTDDYDCGGSTRYHVHQGTLVSCMVVNQGFGPSDSRPVWDFWSFINAIDYTEGVGDCNP
ncbi:MAG: hypothetical protein WBD55_11595, partial [Dehalococcoidia bacterium]